ncbi:MAG: hypothetical protein AAFQ85_10475 [Pseudomonadota bacterium]
MFTRIFGTHAQKTIMPLALDEAPINPPVNISAKPLPAIVLPPRQTDVHKPRILEQRRRRRTRLANRH